MLDAIYNRLFSPTIPVKIQSMGVFKEDASIEVKRAEALKRMREAGRTPILEGGDFTRRLTVLKQEKPCH